VIVLTPKVRAVRQASSEDNDPTDRGGGGFDSAGVSKDTEDWGGDWTQRSTTR